MVLLPFSTDSIEVWMQTFIDGTAVWPEVRYIMQEGLRFCRIVALFIQALVWTPRNKPSIRAWHLPQGRGCLLMFQHQRTTNNWYPVRKDPQQIFILQPYLLCLYISLDSNYSNIRREPRTPSCRSLYLQDLEAQMPIKIR